MKQSKFEMILERYRYEDIKSDNLNARLTAIECLIKYIIDNELAHIWLVLKIILGAIVGGIVALGIDKILR